MRIGRVLHEISEDRVSEVAFENIKLDNISKNYVIEVKKSDSDLEAAKWQLLLYLYKLERVGVKKKGRLEVFEKKKQNKKRFLVELDEKNRKKLLEVLEEIEKIISQDTPPNPKYESKCRKCAYFEYCLL